ncbi:MAG: N-acyl homoserine lactonase family protein [Gemmatimonadota bacterium]|jgi:glyoxylase-like metal-dependent hydrolase (beta-lactamase superfamily II)
MTAGLRRTVLLLTLATLAASACARPGDAGTPSGTRDERPDAAAPPGPTYEVTAVRYATVPGYRVRNLVADADSTRTVDLAMTVWVLRRPDGSAVLVDTGFHRKKFIESWKPVDFMPASEAVARMGVDPRQVTDVILTHVHWDHADGVDLFPGARVWIQKAEYDYYVGEDGSALQRGIDPDDATLLHEARASGRVELVDGDGVEILPGITVYTGGKHTYASQYIGVRTARGVVVVASDNCYLYENLERHAPIAQTLDAASNLAAQDRMREIAAEPSLIVPGHDPAVFERFPEPGGGLARIAGM